MPKILAPILRARYAPLLRGPHGCGKSSIVAEMATRMPEILFPDIRERVAALGEGYVYPFIDLRASQLADAGDLVGLPVIENGVTRFAQQERMRLACVQPCVLLFDEIDRASLDVAQAIFELNDSRKLAGHALHPHTVVFGACNSGHGSQYQVRDMDPAELDRWVPYDVDFPVESFLEKGADWGVDPRILGFLRDSPSHYRHQGEFAPGKVYPSARSWRRLHQVLTPDYYADGEMLFGVATGYVGQAAAIAFQDYVRRWDSRITWETVVIEGRVEALDGRSVEEQLNVVLQLETAEPLAKPLPDEQIHNLARWALQINAELCERLWATVTKRCPANGAKLHATVVNGRSVGSRITQLLQAGKKV